MSNKIFHAKNFYSCLHTTLCYLLSTNIKRLKATLTTCSYLLAEILGHKVSTAMTATTEDSGFSSAESPAKKAHKRTNSQIQTETHKKDQAVIDIPPSPVKTEGTVKDVSRYGRSTLHRF